MHSSTMSSKSLSTWTAWATSFAGWSVDTRVLGQELPGEGVDCRRHHRADRRHDVAHAIGIIGVRELDRAPADGNDLVRAERRAAADEVVGQPANAVEVAGACRILQPGGARRAVVDEGLHQVAYVVGGWIGEHAEPRTGILRDRVAGLTIHVGLP